MQSSAKCSRHGPPCRGGSVEMSQFTARRTAHGLCLLLFSLATRTKERGTLRLDDTDDPARFAAVGASFIGLVVHAVPALVPTRLIQRIAIRAVAKRRAFVLYGRFEDLVSRVRDRIPLRPRNSIARLCRMYSSQVHDFRGIHIANSGDRTLIQKCHLHGPAAATKIFAQFLASDGERIWPNLLRPKRHFQPIGRK